MHVLWALIAIGLALAAAGCGPSGPVVNVYSARHYDSDAELYARFEVETGIKVRVIEADGDLLVEKIKTEGARSPADVILTVDAGRLWRAETAGLFQAVDDPALNAAVPERLRHPEGLWFAMSRRARILVVRNGVTPPADGWTYAALAEPSMKGRVCVRSSANVYNQSLLAALIERWGASRAEAWARGVAANFARAPIGGDTDQIKAVAAGDCDVALVNHYYYARLAASQDRVEQAIAGAVEPVWPDQDGDGAHVNVAGMGVAAGAPHPETARRFLAFMVEDAQQTLIESTNFEFPVRDGLALSPQLEALGAFKEEPLNVVVYGRNQAEATAIFDRVGWP